MKKLLMALALVAGITPVVYGEGMRKVTINNRTSNGVRVSTGAAGLFFIPAGQHVTQELDGSLVISFWNNDNVNIPVKGATVGLPDGLPGDNIPRVEQISSEPEFTVNVSDIEVKLAQ